MLCRSTEHLETCFGRSICSTSWKGKLEKWTCPWSHLWIAGPCPRRSPPESVQQSPVEWSSASNSTKRPCYDKKKSYWRKRVKKNCRTRCVEKNDWTAQTKKELFFALYAFSSISFLSIYSIYFSREIEKKIQFFFADHAGPWSIAKKYLFIQVEVKLLAPLGVKRFIDNFWLVVVFPQPARKTIKDNCARFVYFFCYVEKVEIRAW